MKLLTLRSSYEIGYKLDPERKNAKVHKARVQIIGVKNDFGVVAYTTNRRPWDEGGTGELRHDQIVSATEISTPNRR